MFLTIFTLVTLPGTPVNAATDSQLIAAAALKCGAIYYLLSVLSSENEDSAGLISPLKQLMDDLYVLHGYQPGTGEISTVSRFLASSKAFKELIVRYDEAPEIVANDAIWCIDWNTDLERYFSASSTSESRQLTDVPEPAPPADLSVFNIPETRKLLLNAYRLWNAAGRKTPYYDFIVTKMDDITRNCLNSWPPKLLQELTGIDSIPEDLRDNLSQQNSFLKNYGVRDKGLFYPTNLYHLGPVLKELPLQGKRFLDLGSGDGRVVFLANVLGADATGIEYDTNMFNISHSAGEALETLLAEERLQLFEGDFFTVPWSGYDVIFYYGQGSSEEDRIRAKLKNEMTAGALLIVYRNFTAPEEMELVSEFTYVQLYRKPLH